MRKYPEAARRVAGSLFVLSFLSLAGCTAAPQGTALLARKPSNVPVRIELTAVPFHPQTAYHCGPAALATVLQYGGGGASPEELARSVYIPGLKGSLQPELLAAAREQARVPYVIPGTMEALVTEIAAGNPVLVLQNLGMSLLPRWHYAVVIGYDLDRGELYLRSGTIPRHVTGFRRFERTWARGRHWAVVALPPEQIPATAGPAATVDAIVGFEELGKLDIAARAYAAAVRRFPDHVAAWMGAGNVAYRQGRPKAAMEAFQRALAIDPDHAPAHNNLAHVLMERGRLAEAENHARRAVALGDALHATYRQTLAEILLRKRVNRPRTPARTNPAPR